MKDERSVSSNEYELKASSIIHHPSSLLIVRTDRLGDLVLTLPMASEIKRALPDSLVSFLVSEYTRPIAERCDAIDRVISVDAATSLWQRIKLFRSGHWDAVLFPNPKFTLALAAFLARIPRRIGTGYRWYSLLYNRRIYEHRRNGSRSEADHNLMMLTQIGIDADLKTLPHITVRDEEDSSLQSWLDAVLPDGTTRFAVLHIPTSGSSKDWALDKFVELGKSLCDEFNMAIVLTGLASDQLFLERVQLAIDGGVHLFCGKPLPELAALLRRASVVISNSTGPGHLAATLGTPAIGLFPLPRALARERWGFRGKHSENIAPQPIEGCPDCKECTCMERILVSDVIKVVRELVY